MTYHSPLADLVGHWQPEPLTESAVLDAERAAALGKALDVDTQLIPGDGHELPIPWHWIYFPQWPATADLGPDGHPAHGRFLPPLPDRRRMFAGAQITSHAPLALGTVTEKTSALASIGYKKGGTGDLMFVAVRSEYRQQGQLALTETQDIVYRSDSSAARPFQREPQALAASSAPWQNEPIVQATHLFRYSAMTSNTHRIHYDHPYTTTVEGYPDLVIHGPLLAHYMADLVRRQNPARPLQQFQFTLKRPVFLGDEFRVEAEPTEHGFSARVVTGDGTVHASATGGYR